MRHRPHTHKCDNVKRGCLATTPCSAPYEEDEDGSRHCLYANDLWLCEECDAASGCEECGALDHLLEPHWFDCPAAPGNRDDSLEAKFQVAGDGPAEQAS